MQYITGEKVILIHFLHEVPSMEESMIYVRVIGKLL